MFVCTSGISPAREPGGRVGIGRVYVVGAVKTSCVFSISFFCYIKILQLPISPILHSLH